MTADNKKNQLRDNIILIALFILALAMIVVAAIPSVRQNIKSSFSSQERKVLAKISGQINEAGLHVTVLKIQTGDQLMLEIFENTEDGRIEPLAKIPLHTSKDAFLEASGNASNLSLADIDKDGQMEIVAPTYDEQMVPRLNIFKFNEHSRSFDRMNAPDSYEP